jgi:two-component system, NarL family, sensor histidine kinase DevS
VSRRFGRQAFSRSDLDLLAGFVDHTTVALQLAEVRADRERILLIEDRARIARDLHDLVIQQLFAAGLELRATAADVPVPRVHAGIDRGVTLIDGAIDRIRTAVLAISPDPVGALLRHRILDVVRDLSREFVQAPELRFDGPVELVARGGLGEDVVAVVREALTNVARHADARRAGVRVSVPEGRIRVEVWDDGRGFPETASPRRGLANLEERASRRGGDFTIGTRSGTTRAVWTAPYSEGSAQ